jgi:DNA-binding transcriptional ArsR family regulator
MHKALSHELRVEILTFLSEHTMASPVEMSKELGASIGTVSHHVKQLVKYGCAEEVKTRPRRGAVEHFYRATSRPVISNEDLTGMAGSARHAFAGQVVERAFDDLNSAFDGGTIAGRTDWHLTRVSMSLDAEGWEELRAIHKRVLDETYEVQARSHKRRSKSGEEPIRASTIQLCFEVPAS